MDDEERYEEAGEDTEEAGEGGSNNLSIGMCIGLTPVIGLTLPFFSYGGSSMFSLFAAMGLVSGVKYRPKPERFYHYS